MLILMGVRNGAAYLPEQLDSLRPALRQGWRLRIGEGGSTDGSVQLLRDFAGDLPDNLVSIRSGDAAGHAPNYLKLLADLPDMPGMVALSDQDDIWLPGRLDRARSLLNRVPPHVPAFLFARRIAWWPGRAGRKPRLRPSDHPVRRPCFENALLENVVFGNTLVLNAQAARIARAMAPLAGGIYAHDWWLYQLLTGAGAMVLYDPQPALLYRQHAGNAIGAGLGARAWLRRKGAVLTGLYAQRLDAQLAALHRCEAALSPENRTTLEAFRQSRALGPRERLRRSQRLGLFRQTREGRIGFIGGTLLGLV